MKAITAYQSTNGVLYTSKEACATAEGLVVCPQCKSNGKVKVMVKTPYPRGLPDSDYYEFTEKEEEVECDLCKGVGFTTPKKRDAFIKYEESLNEYNKNLKHLTVLKGW